MSLPSILTEGAVVAVLMREVFTDLLNQSYAIACKCSKMFADKQDYLLEVLTWAVLPEPKNIVLENTCLK